MYAFEIFIGFDSDLRNVYKMHLIHNLSRSNLNMNVVLTAVSKDHNRRTPEFSVSIIIEGKTFFKLPCEINMKYSLAFG